MAKYQLTIADQDEGYCGRFLKYLSEYESGRIKANCITDAKYLRDLKENGPVDILLISQELYNGNVDHLNAKTLIILTGGRISAELEDFHVISKYQAADVLVNEIIRLYQEDHPGERSIERSTGNSRVIGVYSPITKCGKTTCAIVLSKVLARSGKSVFYLNLEDFPSTEAYLTVKNNNAMSDVFYYSKERSRNFLPKLMEKAEKTEGGYLYYLSPAVSAADMGNIASGNWEFVMNELKSSSSFDYVVVDFSSRYDEKTLLQLSFCDSLILLTSTDYVDTVKLDQFTKTLELTDSDLLKHGSVQILNQYSPGIKYDVPKGGYGIPFINGLVDKSQKPYEIVVDSMMGKILMNLVLSFPAGEHR